MSNNEGNQVTSLTTGNVPPLEDAGPKVWGIMNAVSFIVLTCLLALGLTYGAKHMGNAQHVKKQ